MYDLQRTQRCRLMQTVWCEETMIYEHAPGDHANLTACLGGRWLSRACSRDSAITTKSATQPSQMVSHDANGAMTKHLLAGLHQALTPRYLPAGSPNNGAFLLPLSICRRQKRNVRLARLHNVDRVSRGSSHVQWFPAQA